MKLTVKQLRSIIKEEVSKVVRGPEIPKVGDQYEVLDLFITDQASNSAGKSFYFRRSWNQGDVVEVVSVTPIRGQWWSKNSSRGGLGIRKDKNYRILFKAVSEPKGITGDYPADYSIEDTFYSTTMDDFLSDFQKI